MGKKGRGLVVGIFVLIFILGAYIMASLLINNVATFTIEPKICPIAFCISGLPINVQLEFNKNTTGSVVINSKSAIEKEKTYDFSDGNLNLEIPTERNLPSKNYDLSIKLSSSLWNIILDPITFIEYSVIGKTQSLEFKYPDISVIQKGESCTKEGIHYDQINLQNADKEKWNCKIMLSISERSEVSPEDFNFVKSLSHRDFHETTPGDIPLSGSTYGFTNIDIKSPSCKDRVAVDIFPVCIINGEDIELLHKQHSKECPIPDNRC